MVTRLPLVSVVAAFLAASAVVGLLPRIGDLLFGPAIFHPVPSATERALDGARDLLLCASLALAFLLWLHRRRVRYILFATCFAIGLIALVLPCCSRSIFSYPVFDPVAIGLRDAIPWFFFAGLLCHSSLTAGFAQPIPFRFSVRCFLVAAVVHIALFITVEAVPILPYAARDALGTFLLLPARIMVGLIIIQFGAGRTLLDSAVYSTAGPLLDIVASALVWGSVIALIWSRVRYSRSPKPSNQTMQPTAGRSDV